MWDRQRSSTLLEAQMLCRSLQLQFPLCQTRSIFGLIESIDRCLVTVRVGTKKTGDVFCCQNGPLRLSQSLTNVTAPNPKRMFVLIKTCCWFAFASSYRVLLLTCLASFSGVYGFNQAHGTLGIWLDKSISVKFGKSVPGRLVRMYIKYHENHLSMSKCFILNILV